MIDVIIMLLTRFRVEDVRYLLCLYKLQAVISVYLTENGFHIKVYCSVFTTQHMQTQFGSKNMK